MIQPHFKAWYKRGATGLTTLVMTFKVLVLTESGQLNFPPNCAYADEDADALQGNCCVGHTDHVRQG
eukprot:4188892-Pleurochrysis_carterae.AAC.1